MTLKEYVALTEEGTEITVWDNEYDIECYFYNEDPDDDLFFQSINKLSSLINIVSINNNGVTVNFCELIEKNIDKLEKANLFIDCDIESVMCSLHSIISGYVSPDWMKKFVNCLE